MNKLSDSHKTQNRRFGSLLINADLRDCGEKINSDLSKIFGSLSDKQGAKTMFFVLCESLSSGESGGGVVRPTCT